MPQERRWSFSALFRVRNEIMDNKACKGASVAPKHKNIPIFIPHLGCPNLCVFCNQRSISGKQSFCRERVVSEIEEALNTIPADYEVEIAYFGG